MFLRRSIAILRPVVPIASSSACLLASNTVALVPARPNTSFSRVSGSDRVSSSALGLSLGYS